MSGKKINSYTDGASLQDQDLFYGLRSPYTAGNDIKLSGQQLKSSINNSTVVSGSARIIANYKENTCWPVGLAYEESTNKLLRFETIQPGHAVEQLRSATITIASPAVFTLAAHGYVADQAVTFTTTGSLPTGLSTSTTYYILSTGLTNDSFRVSTSVGGAAVNTSGTQSGTHYPKPATIQHESRLDMYISNDFGYSWYGRKTIYSSDVKRIVAGNAIANMASGRIGGIITVAENLTEISTRQHLFLYSDDGGINWTTVDLTDVSTYSLFPYGMLMPLPTAYGGNDVNGFYVACYGGIDAFTFIKTTDNGATWSSGTLKVNDDVWSTFLQEPSVVITNHGAIAFLRGGDGVNLHIITSDDFTTWSDFEDTGVTLGANPVHAVYDSETDIIEVIIADRDESSFGGTLLDNTIRVYKIKAASLYDNASALSDVEPVFAWHCGNRAIGYFQSLRLGDRWYHVAKAKESPTSTNKIASCELMMISNVPYPVRKEMNSIQVLDNPDFSIWQSNTTFVNITTQQVTADRWEYVPSGGTANVSRVLLSENKSLIYPHKPKYGLNFVAGAEDFIGLYQYHYNESAEYLFNLLKGKPELDLIVYGYGTPVPNFRAQLGFNFGSGGGTAVTNSVVFSNTFVVNTGSYVQSVRLQAPQLDFINVGTNPFVYLALTTSTSAAVNTTFTGIFLYNGYAPDEPQAWSYQENIRRCERYRRKWSSDTLLNRNMGVGFFSNSTTFEVPVRFDSALSLPVNAFQVGANSNWQARATANYVASGITITGNSRFGTTLNLTVSGATGGQAGALQALDANAYILFSTGH